MVSKALLTKDLGIKKVNKVSRILNSKRKRDKNNINIAYQYEANEDMLNRVFDLIFEEIIKRRKEKQSY